MDKTDYIDRVSREPQDRLLLSRVWDKYQQAQRRSVPAATEFLSPREQQLAFALLQTAGVRDRWLADGGYPDAERRRIVFLPDWAGDDEAEGQLVFLRAAFRGRDASLGHRDLLGSLMGLGVAREKLGDILVSPHSADLVAAPSLRDFFLLEWKEAGRVKLEVGEIARAQLLLPETTVKEIHDTVSSLRLDAVIAAAFSTSRGRAAEWIQTGRVSVNHLLWEKPDRPVPEGAVLTVRGQGRARLKALGGLTKKGRTSVTIEKYGN